MVYICIYELCFLYCYCICIIYACSSLVEEIISSADFLQNSVFTNRPPRNSLDPDPDRCSVGLHLGSNCLQKAIGRRQNYPLACNEL